MIDINLALLTYDARISVRNGFIRGISRFANTEHIALSENITRYGISLNFSFPWAVGATISGNTQTWQSGVVRNAVMVTRHRPAFSGSWIARPITARNLVSIVSSADIAARTGNTVNIHTANNSVILGAW
ncbi:MAG: hypothetical protein FWF50_02525 [Defluviitaleaceae bacterium]|nr:hypothetical protein [Defluviitaleaceae bacterium]